MPDALQILEVPVELLDGAPDAGGADDATHAFRNIQFALYAALTNYEQSRYNYILNVLRLKQAAGTLQVQDLEQIDMWLTERKTPEQAFAEEEAAAEGS